MILVASGAAGDESLALDALEAATRAADNIRLCGVLSQLGARAYYAGRWDMAIERYGQSCDAGARGGDVWLVAVVRSNIAEVLVEQRRFGEAEPLLLEAIDVFRAADTPSPWAFAELLLGRLCAHSGRAEDADGHFNMAVQLYRRLHLDADADEVRLWRADAAVTRGDAAEALSLLDEVPDATPLVMRTRGLALLIRGAVVAGSETLRQAVTSAGSVSPYELYCSLQALQRSPLLSAVERATARSETTELEQRLSIVPFLVLPYDAPPVVAIPTQRADRPEEARTS
jgi:tetratricopeptide (TPR) repeat protein